MNFQKIRTMGFTVCVAAACFCIAIGFAKYAQLNSAKDQLQATEEELQKLKIEIAQVQKLMEDYDNEKTEFSQYLFNERNIPAFLDEISKMAAESRIDIMDMKTLSFHQVVVSPEYEARRYGVREKPQEPTAEELRQQVLTLSAMPIVISLKGQFKDLAVFLDKLQSYKQLVSITNMNIGQIQGAYPSLDCHFTLNIYSIKTLAELK